jgi:rhodanese-related sulfurtransferase
MKTMDCATLEVLIENHEPIDMIDVRAEKEFAAMHIPGARSFPLSKLAARKIFIRPRPRDERIYVISNDRASASMAVGILRSEGWSDPVVVDGGMKAWIGNHFPVRSEVVKVPVFLYTGAILSGIAVMLAMRNVTHFAWQEVLMAALLLVIAAALVLKAKLLTLVQRLDSETADRTPRGKVVPAGSGIGFMQAAHS